MPPRRKQTEGSAKLRSTTRHEPYQTTQREKRLPSAASYTPENAPKGSRNSVLYREACLECVRRCYPDYADKLRHDFDLYVLASYDGPVSEIASYLDLQLSRRIASLGSLEAVLEEAKESLEQYVTITGMKPPPTAAHVYTRPIPNSEYSVRLWPGDDAVGEFCMDFVHSETQQPVNSPFEYELWLVPNPATPWLPAPTVCLRSLETCFGVAKNRLRAGEEKFVLKEGQTCLLTRPGRKGVRFTVPVMPRPTPTEDVDVLDFPQTLK
ncbi:hypothetical protein K466DRAFT_558947 [Polyporus arcularius HHB13444]|uniref:Uncharacterized protein n=1 Tax=Polyporus arcularius HHB13444 TaxID=1314778 RepID=A0A5C3NVF2_9APHY|nr:hypothetical protein K466DRAFT_558947 [Polyporus arcularius HHB13444]